MPKRLSLRQKRPYKPDYLPRVLPCGQRINGIKPQHPEDIECCLNACQDESIRGNVEAVDECNERRRSTA